MTLTIKSESWRAASKNFLPKVFVCAKINKLKSKHTSEPSVYVSHRRKQKALDFLRIRLSGACAYQRRYQALPLIVIIVVVEELVDNLVDDI